MRPDSQNSQTFSSAEDSQYTVYSHLSTADYTNFLLAKLLWIRYVNISVGELLCFTKLNTSKFKFLA